MHHLQGLAPQCTNTCDGISLDSAQWYIMNEGAVGKWLQVLQRKWLVKNPFANVYNI